MVTPKDAERKSLAGPKNLSDSSLQSALSLAQILKLLIKNHLITNSVLFPLPETSVLIK